MIARELERVPRRGVLPRALRSDGSSRGEREAGANILELKLGSQLQNFAVQRFSSRSGE